MSGNKCPSCGASIDLNVTECKYCGQVIATKQNISAGQTVFKNIQIPNNQFQVKIQYNDSPEQVVEYGQPQQNNQNQQFNKSQQYQQPPKYNNPPTNKSKVVAGILAILLGGLGIHKFYLGRIGLGIVYVLFCWTYIPAIVGLIEGIIYLASSEENFYNKYVRK